MPIPERVAPKPIAPQTLSGGYQLDPNTPAYKSRRGMMLMNEIKGKKVIIKVDGSYVDDEVVTDTTQQQALDF